MSTALMPETCHLIPETTPMPEAWSLMPTRSPSAGRCKRTAAWG